MDTGMNHLDVIWNYHFTTIYIYIDLLNAQTIVRHMVIFRYHYSDVVASQISSNLTVYSITSSTWWLTTKKILKLHVAVALWCESTGYLSVDSPHKGPAMQKYGVSVSLRVNHVNVLIRWVLWIVFNIELFQVTTSTGIELHLVAQQNNDYNYCCI